MRSSLELRIECSVVGVNKGILVLNGSIDIPSDIQIPREQRFNLFGAEAHRGLDCRCPVPEGGQLKGTYVPTF